MTGNDFQPFQQRDEMSDLFRLLFTTVRLTSSLT